MNNTQRKSRVHDLSGQIKPLLHDNFMDQIKHDYHIGLYRRNQSEADGVKAQNLQLAIANRKKQLEPLLIELNSIRVAYLVIYEGELMSNGILTTQTENRVLYLSVDCNVDFPNNPLDLSDADIQTVVGEIRDYIYNTQFSNFTIVAIRKMQ